MFKIGLKLWSINDNYVKEAIHLYEKKVFDYIELFAVPNSYDKYINLWKTLKIPYVIHAAHSAVGLNLSKGSWNKEKERLSDEAKKFADFLNSEFIIFHPGVDGEIDNTVDALLNINDNRILIENKPYFGIYNNLICNGNSPEEIKYIMDNAKVGFCFDIGHAICSARALNIPQDYFLKKFNGLAPKMYHLTDGDVNSVYDEHLHFGKGSYNLIKLISLIKNGSNITVEVDKSYNESLEDFEEDMVFFEKIKKQNFRNKYE